MMGLARHPYRTQLTDLCHGLFSFRRQFLDELGLRYTGSEIETRITAHAILVGPRA